MKIVAITVVLVVLVGCGGDEQQVESLDQLGDMLTEQGIACSDLEADSGDAHP